jgi:hypothetical protein
MIGTLYKGGIYLNFDEKLIKVITRIVNQILTKQGLLQGQWHLGTVDQVISNKKTKVFVDGSDIAQTVSCNPDLNLVSGDSVWVIFINNNPLDKFIISKRAV